jgi:hypothetical protein
MDILAPLTVVGIVLIVGIVFALFPRWGIRAICRCARSYMEEDLSGDPAQVMAVRFYGLAAVGLGLYALYQVVQAL